MTRLFQIAIALFVMSIAYDAMHDTFANVATSYANATGQHDNE